MKFSLVTFALAAATSVSAGPFKRQNVQADYDRESGFLKEDGLCRVYEKGDGPHETSLGLCDDMCAPSRELAVEQNGFSSVACSATQATSLPYFADPEGKMYTLGKCYCNLPAVTVVGHLLTVTIPELGLVTCAVWKQAGKQAAQILAGTLGGARADTGAKTLWKVFKTLRKSGQSASEWEEYVQAHLDEPEKCGVDSAELAATWEKVPEGLFREIQ
jgi:hypothetical protein